MGWLWLSLMMLGVASLGFALWRLLGRSHDHWGAEVNRAGPPPEDFMG